MTNDEVAGALLRLVAIVDADLPKTFYPGERVWRPIAAGYMARMADIARSTAVLTLAGCSDDALVLSRVMYEQMVGFCWIAAEPKLRVELWKDSYEAHQRAAHEDAKKYGIKILTAKQLAKAKGKKKLSVERLAKEADDYWSPRIEGFRILSGEQQAIDILTITGLYLGVYRAASRIVHGTVQSLDSVMRRSGTRTIVERRVSPTAGFAPTAAPIFVMAIAVHHKLFGWPDIDKAREISDSLVWEPE